MKQPTIAEVAGRELVWVQVAIAKPEYKLYADGRVIASLFGNRGQCMNQSWTFKRKGWFHRRAIVRAPASNVNAAVCNWSRQEGGVLVLPDSRTFHFAAAADCSPVRYDWIDSDGKPLARFQTREGLDLSEASVEIKRKAVRVTELPLLVVLGQYLVTLFAARHRDVPDVWTVLDLIDIPWPSLPELPDIPGLPDIDW